MAVIGLINPGEDMTKLQTKGKKTYLRERQPPSKCFKNKESSYLPTKICVTILDCLIDTQTARSYFIFNVA